MDCYVLVFGLSENGGKFFTSEKEIVNLTESTTH